MSAIKRLKCNKTCGTDQIINEFFKSTVEVIAPVLCKLFNIVLHTGIVPENWCIGIINPIYKGKGNDNDPNNFRGISL